jgi:cytochrome c biogenesis factor
MSWLWVGGLLVAVGGVMALAPRLARSAQVVVPERADVPAEAST